MSDTVATSQGAIASPDVHASAQEPEVINLATEELSQAVRVVKPASVYRPTTGQEYEMLDATIAAIESVKVPQGLRHEVSREEPFLTPLVKISSLKDGDTNYTCQFFC